MPSGAEIALGVSDGEEWVDVLARRRKKGERAGACTGSYALHGYSITEQRWSYGDGPPGAGEIRAYLEAFFTQH